MKNQYDAILALTLALPYGRYQIRRAETMRWEAVDEGYGYTVSSDGSGELTKGMMDQAEMIAEDYAADIAHLEAAYSRLRKASGYESVFISDLVKETGWAMERCHAVIRMHEGNQLDEADWSCATEEQRAAHMMLRDRKRLYVKLN